MPAESPTPYQLPELTPDALDALADVDHPAARHAPHHYAGFTLATALLRDDLARWQALRTAGDPPTVAGARAFLTCLRRHQRELDGLRRELAALDVGALDVGRIIGEALAAWRAGAGAVCASLLSPLAPMFDDTAGRLRAAGWEVIELTTPTPWPEVAKRAPAFTAAQLAEVNGVSGAAPVQGVILLPPARVLDAR